MSSDGDDRSKTKERLARMKKNDDDAMTAS
jgi:hypothetical protein